MASWQLALVIIIPLLIVGGIFAYLASRRNPGDVQVDLQAPELKPAKKPVKPVEEKVERIPVSLEQLNLKALEEKDKLDTDMYFSCLEGTNKGEAFLITRYVSTLGRRSTDGRVNDIEFSSVEKKISRTQGMIVFHPDSNTFYLINESSSPIMVNREPIEKAYPLEEGDKIEMGGGDVVLSFLRQKH